MSESGPEKCGETVFTALMEPFPELKDGKINTDEFLKASLGILKLVDKLGKVFAPVRYDMDGNIIKLMGKYHENVGLYFFIEDMITDEKNNGGNHATEALQWLRRGLHFLQRFLELIFEDKDEKCSISAMMKSAYTDSLEQYHGWMGAQLFNIMCRFAPSRSDLMKILSMGNLNGRSNLQKDIPQYLTNLKQCVEHLTLFYEENNYETTNRV